MTDKLRLGELLIEAGVLKTEKLEEALKIQKERQLRLGTILLQENFVDEAQLVQALSRRLSIPWVSLWHIDIPDELLELVPVSVAEEFFLIPIYIRTTGTGEKSLYVAMNDPTDDSALRFVAASSSMSVKPMIAAPSDIASAIRFYYYGEDDESEPTEQTVPSRPMAGSAPPPPPRQATQVPKIPSKKPPTPLPEILQASNPPLPPTPPPKPTKGEIKEPPDEDITELDLSDQEISEVSEEEQAVDQKPLEEDDITPTDETEEEKKQRTQREVEKHMFGVGRSKPKRALSLTLLDGTTIAFGGATQAKDERKPTEALTAKDLIAGLRASAQGTPLDDFLPSSHWEDYMASLLEILLRKHLIFYDEFMKELQKKK